MSNEAARPGVPPLAGDREDRRSQSVASCTHPQVEPEAESVATDGTARRAAIIRLLRTRDENLPEPRHRTETTSSGFVHGGLDDKGHHQRWLTCPDCLANEGLPKKWGCETCGGRGQVPDPGRDPYAVNETIAYGLDGSRHDAAYERDRQIDALGRQLRPASDVDELADANAHPFAWEAARQRMLKEYDYRALDAALEQLRVADDGASRALHAVYVYGWQKEPTGPLQEACDRGLMFIDERMPEEIRAPAEPPPVVNTVARGRAADPRARNQRDNAIVRAINDGAPTERVASSFGLSVSQVNKIVRAA